MYRLDLTGRTSLLLFFLSNHFFSRAGCFYLRTTVVVKPFCLVPVRFCSLFLCIFWPLHTGRSRSGLAELKMILVYYHRPTPEIFAVLTYREKRGKEKGEEKREHWCFGVFFFFVFCFLFLFCFGFFFFPLLLLLLFFFFFFFFHFLKPLKFVCGLPKEKFLPEKHIKAFVTPGEKNQEKWLCSS